MPVSRVWGARPGVVRTDRAVWVKLPPGGFAGRREAWLVHRQQGYRWCTAGQFGPVTVHISWAVRPFWTSRPPRESASARLRPRGHLCRNVGYLGPADSMIDLEHTVLGVWGYSGRGLAWVALTPVAPWAPWGLWLLYRGCSAWPWLAPSLCASGCCSHASLVRGCLSLPDDLGPVSLLAGAIPLIDFARSHFGNLGLACYSVLLLWFCCMPNYWSVCYHLRQSSSLVVPPPNGLPSYCNSWGVGTPMGGREGSHHAEPPPLFPFNRQGFTTSDGREQGKHPRKGT